MAPTSLLPSSNLNLSLFFTYYGAPTSNRSLQKVVDATTPITYPGTNPPRMGFYATNNYLFYLQAMNTNGTKGTIYLTYPWSESATRTSSVVGTGKQVYTAVYQYISLQASANYGYTFKGWYNQFTGGTLISSSSVVNVYYNNPYAGSLWFAQWV